MFVKLLGATTLGLNGNIIEVETDISNGLPSLEIVGLATTAVKESKERVRSAIKNNGYSFPIRKITINLAPADFKKDSAGLDLPIALGILASSGQVLTNEFKDSIFIGELSLEGKIRSINGIISMVLKAIESGIKNVYVAKDNFVEANLCKGANIFVVEKLSDVVEHLNKNKLLKKEIILEEKTIKNVYQEDFSDVQGQIMAKRALEIAAAGGHNVLMIGSPGSGKTMLARRINSILPPMLEQEALEVTKIYSVSGLFNQKEMIKNRPFRSPHHTISSAGLIGGGSIPKPGEVTLSHNGVLFLDEFPEFPRAVLEVLRQPLEDGIVNISRVNATLTYPADFILIAAMNPCPCGFYLDEKKECVCSENERRRYLRKISGPLLDRIDLHVNVQRPEYHELSSKKNGEFSVTIRERVMATRQKQVKRLQKYGIACNAQMNHAQLKSTILMSDKAENILKNIFEKLQLSARSYDKVIKVAKTIADLDNADIIEDIHIAEAISYRNSFNM